MRSFKISKAPPLPAAAAALARPPIPLGSWVRVVSSKADQDHLGQRMKKLNKYPEAIPPSSSKTILWSSSATGALFMGGASASAISMLQQTARVIRRLRSGRIATFSSSSSTGGLGSGGRSSPTSSRRRDPSLLLGSGWERGSESVAIAVWWDFENCNVPLGIEAYKVGVNIVSGLRMHGFKGPVSISAYGDTLQLSRTTQEALASTGIRLQHIPSGGKDSSDRALLVDLMLWAFEHPPPAHLFLISGDRDFSNALHRLRMMNYNILLACPAGTVVSPALLGAATYVWQWNCLVRGEGLLMVSPPHSPSSSSSSSDGCSRPPDGGSPGGGAAASVVLRQSGPKPQQQSPGTKSSDLNGTNNISGPAGKVNNYASSPPPPVSPSATPIVYPLVSPPVSPAAASASPSSAPPTPVKSLPKGVKGQTIPKPSDVAAKASPTSLPASSAPLQCPGSKPCENKKASADEATATTTPTPTPPRQPPTEVLEQLQSLLLSSPGGMMLGDLQRYMSTEKLTLEKDFYGHGKLVPFLSSIPEVVQLERVLNKDCRTYTYRLTSTQRISNGSSRGQEFTLITAAADNESSTAPSAAAAAKSDVEAADQSNVDCPDITTGLCRSMSRDQIQQETSAVDAPAEKQLPPARTKSVPEHSRVTSAGESNVEETSSHMEQDQSSSSGPLHSFWSSLIGVFGSRQRNKKSSESVPAAARSPDRSQAKNESQFGSKSGIEEGGDVHQKTVSIPPCPQKGDDCRELGESSALEEKATFKEEKPVNLSGDHDKQQPQHAADGGDVKEVVNIKKLMHTALFETGRKKLLEVPKGISESSSKSVYDLSDLDKVTWIELLSCPQTQKQKKSMERSMGEGEDEFRDSDDAHKERGFHPTRHSRLSVWEDLERYLSTAEGNAMISTATSRMALVKSIGTSCPLEFRHLQSSEVSDFIDQLASTGKFRSQLSFPQGNIVSATVREEGMQNGAKDHLKLQSKTLSKEGKGTTDVTKSQDTKTPNNGGGVSDEEQGVCALLPAKPGFRQEVVESPNGNQLPAHQATNNRASASTKLPSGSSSSSIKNDMASKKQIGGAATGSLSSNSVAPAPAPPSSPAPSPASAPAPAPAPSSSSSTTSSDSNDNNNSSLPAAGPPQKGSYPSLGAFQVWFVENMKESYRCSERTQKIGFDLSLVKPDFERVFGIRLDPKLYGFTKLQDLVASVKEVTVLRHEMSIVCLPKVRKLFENEQQLQQNSKEAESISLSNKVSSWPKMFYDCKSLVRELMLENMEGLAGYKLKPLFLERFQYPLDHKSVGYQRMSDLLRLMPDVVSVNGKSLVPSEELLLSLKAGATADPNVHHRFSVDADSVASCGEHLNSSSVQEVPLENTGHNFSENWGEIDIVGNGNVAQCDEFIGGASPAEVEGVPEDDTTAVETDPTEEAKHFIGEQVSVHPIVPGEPQIESEPPDDSEMLKLSVENKVLAQEQEQEQAESFLEDTDDDAVATSRELMRRVHRVEERGVDGPVTTAHEEAVVDEGAKADDDLRPPDVAATGHSDDATTEGEQSVMRLMSWSRAGPVNDKISAELNSSGEGAVLVDVCKAPGEGEKQQSVGSTAAESREENQSTPSDWLDAIYPTPWRESVNGTQWNLTEHDSTNKVKEEEFSCTRSSLGFQKEIRQSTTAGEIVESSQESKSGVKKLNADGTSTETDVGTSPRSKKESSTGHCLREEDGDHIDPCKHPHTIDNTQEGLETIASDEPSGGRRPWESSQEPHTHIGIRGTSSGGSEEGKVYEGSGCSSPSPSNQTARTTGPAKPVADLEQREPHGGGGGGGGGYLTAANLVGDNTAQLGGKGLMTCPTVVSYDSERIITTADENVYSLPEKPSSQAGELAVRVPLPEHFEEQGQSDETSNLSSYDHRTDTEVNFSILGRHEKEGSAVAPARAEAARDEKVSLSQSTSEEEPSR